MGFTPVYKKVLVNEFKVPLSGIFVIIEQKGIFAQVHARAAPVYAAVQKTAPFFLSPTS
jgi:hypothetical protein